MNRLEPMPPGAAAASTVEFGSLKDLVGRHPPRPRLALNIGITGHRAALLPEGAYEALRPLVDRVFEGLSREPFVGRTERELAWWLEQAWHEAGADGASFPAVVAFG